MTLERIIEELKSRYDVLKKSENALLQKRIEIRSREPFCGLTNYEIECNPKLYGKLRKAEKPYDYKLFKVQHEMRVIQKMLTAVDKNRL